ncbi:hypothetical protein AJ78_03272 [Emergomyces pasteurianus Ep9510]|uniref:Uncharacterized protein n=1 Tax=Emergomyces pasteurianus Ep9510 TaxID=1447872 RepID=A0A1J9QMY0_9EURO|nr:hypothetical protein AJ78_03272 [Emergomyces pasteurianus Ep9510]
MAPRRGGGGGGSFGGSSSASCSSSAFTSTNDQIYLGYFIAFFVIDSVLLWMASRLFKLKRSDPFVRWPLMLSVILNVFIHGWNLLFLVLGECGAIGINLNVKLSLVSGFLSVIATSLLVGAVMVPICKRIHQVANMSPRLIATLHGLLVTGFAVFYFIAACLIAAITTMESGFSTYRRRRALASLIVAWNGVVTFTGVVLLLGMLSTAFNLVSPMSRSKVLQSSSLRRNILCLALSSICFGAFFLADRIVAYRVTWKQSSNYDLLVSYYAMEALCLFFHSLTFLFALLVATSTALTDGVQSVAQEQPAQPQSNYAYPIQSNPPDFNVPLMQQYPQQSYPPVPSVQPYQQPHQLYDPHHHPVPAPYH